MKPNIIISIEANMSKEDLSQYASELKEYVKASIFWLDHKYKEKVKFNIKKNNV